MLRLAMTIRDDDASRNALQPLRPRENDLAFRDGLTGLYNYRLLEQLLEERWKELLRLVDRFAIVILDLDLFKEVNDRYGHLSGDEVLRETGKILHRTFRRGDFVFRYGGDEFVVLLPDASAAEAAALGERARSSMLEAEFIAPEEERRIEIPVSFSIGVAAYPDDGENGKAVLARADERLYREKQALRHKVRRRRLVVTGGALAAVGALALAVVLWFFDRQPAPIGSPSSPAATTAQITSPATENDEKLLLARITELQEEIARLTRETREQPEPAREKNSDEIAALQAQVLELTDRLDSRTTDVVPAPAESMRPAPDRTAPDPQPNGAPLETRAATQAPATAPQQPARVVVVPPRLLEPVIPKYPPMALERRVEASVEFEVLVDDSGRVVVASPVGPPRGLGFDDAARVAALASRWSPGTRAGAPAPMEARLIVHFKIR